MKLGLTRHEHLSVLHAQGSLEAKHIPAFSEGLLRLHKESTLTLLVDLSASRISEEAALIISEEKEHQKSLGHKYILISNQVPKADFNSLLEALNHLNITHAEVVHEILRLKLEQQNFDRGMRDIENQFKNIFKTFFKEDLALPISTSHIENRITFLLERRDREFPILQKLKAEIQNLFPFYQNIDRTPHGSLEEMRNHLLKELEKNG